MKFLARDSVEFPDGFWDMIDNTVVDNVRRFLTGRQFLPLFGPLGTGALSIQVDTAVDEKVLDGIVKTTGRQFVEIPQIFEDFTLLWRDIEYSQATGHPMDLSSIIAAAQAIAYKEDKLIFFGNEFLGVKGLLNSGSKFKKSDWSKGENAFTDVAEGLSSFRSNGILGRYTLIVSPDLFVQLQRIQPALGMTEAERITKMLNGNLIQSPILNKNSAVLVCGESQYMDLALGIDVKTGYLETKDFNHVFRIVETALLRIKRNDAIIVYE
jgi:uncharacterized linocin/CFP29 family protein